MKSDDFKKSLDNLDLSIATLVSTINWNKLGSRNPLVNALTLLLDAREKINKCYNIQMEQDWIDQESQFIPYRRISTNTTD